MTEYAKLFYKLEKKNLQKAYWIDLCRRDNLSFFDFPMWFGALSGTVGIFLSKISSAANIILFGGWGMFIVATIASLIIHNIYEEKLRRALNKE